eukprot:6469714-Amphidinium_carterae.1
MFATLALIKSQEPASGLIENVEGFGVETQFERSGLSVCSEQLTEMGYAVQHFTLDLVDFMPCSRKRTNFTETRKTLHCHDNQLPDKVGHTTMKQCSCTSVMSSFAGRFGSDKVVRQQASVSVGGIWVVFVHEKAGGDLTLRRIAAKITNAYNYVVSVTNPVPLDKVLFSDDEHAERKRKEETQALLLLRAVVHGNLRGSNKGSKWGPSGGVFGVLQG